MLLGSLFWEDPVRVDFLSDENVQDSINLMFPSLFTSGSRWEYGDLVDFAPQTNNQDWWMKLCYCIKCLLNLLYYQVAM